MASFDPKPVWDALLEVTDAHMLALEQFAAEVDDGFYPSDVTNYFDFAPLPKVYSRRLIWRTPIPATRIGRMKLKLRVYRYRLRDAWLVLIGKATVDE